MQIESLQKKLMLELDEQMSRQEYETRLLLITVIQDMLKNIRDTLQKLG